MALLKCSKCGVEKPPEEFYVQKDRAKPRSMQPCKVCKKAYLKKWYSKTWRRRPEPPEGHKYCPACKQILPLDKFQVNAGRPDGKQAYCEECWPKYQAKYRLKPEAREVHKAKLRRLHRNPEWLNTNRRKIYARMLTRLMILFGYLEEQSCEICGEPAEVHHTQYDKPLDGIRWLCPKHHMSHGHGGDFTNPPQ